MFSRNYKIKHAYNFRDRSRIFIKFLVPKIQFSILRQDIKSESHEYRTRLPRFCCYLNDNLFAGPSSWSQKNVQKHQREKYFRFLR